MRSRHEHARLTAFVEGAAVGLIFAAGLGFGGYWRGWHAGAAAAESRLDPRVSGDWGDPGDPSGWNIAPGEAPAVRTPSIGGE